MLSDAAIRVLKPVGRTIKKSDGGGLFIEVTPAGKRLWRLAYRFAGKQKLLSGGAYPAVSLAAARRWRDEMREHLAAGRDPSVVRRAEATAAKSAASNTFEATARDWLARKRSEWKPTHYDRIVRRLERDVFPIIGAKPITEIDGPVLLEMIRRVEEREAIHVAHRIRAACGAIFRFGVAEGRVTRDPSRDITDAQRRKAPVRHRARLREDQLGTLLAQIANDSSAELGHLMTRLLILTAVRTGELRWARWAELENLEGAAPIWRIPPTRMKGVAGRAAVEHVVPLSRQAVALFRRLKEINGDKQYIFAQPLARSGVVSENTTLNLLRRLGYAGIATGHGFRASFSTWGNERDYRPDAIELALSHIQRDRVRAAYNSARLLPERARLFQDWADWLENEEQAARLVG